MRLLFFGILPFLLAVSFTLPPGDAFGCGKGCSIGKRAKKSVAKEASCCASADDESSCCGKNQPVSDKKQRPACDHQGDHKGCGGRCGGKCGGHCACPTAASGAGLFSEVEFFLYPFIPFSGASFPYQSPFLPNVSLDIWLPPNILS